MFRSALTTASRPAARRSFHASSALAARTPIVGGNWKMNAGDGTSVAAVKELMTGLNAASAPNCEVFICPPSPYLDIVSSSASAQYNVCSQNVNENTSGAYTGEVSAEMLTDMGVNWTLVGHSERRDIVRGAWPCCSPCSPPSVLPLLYCCC